MWGQIKLIIDNTLKLSPSQVPLDNLEQTENELIVLMNQFLMQYPEASLHDKIIAYIGNWAEEKWIELENTGDERFCYTFYIILNKMYYVICGSVVHCLSLVCRAVWCEQYRQQFKKRVLCDQSLIRMSKLMAQGDQVANIFPGEKKEISRYLHYFFKDGGYIPPADSLSSLCARSIVRTILKNPTKIFPSSNQFPIQIFCDISEFDLTEHAKNKIFEAAQIRSQCCICHMLDNYYWSCLFDNDELSLTSQYKF